ncbi:MAG: hypothetical protein SGI72_04310 [Planctomycetota bacterium]|nr:hypothetical protein [Planctomycetota bacterium]
MSTHDELQSFLAQLSAHSYRLRFRRAEWVEVFVANASDNWIGRGIDRRSALRDACRQMFPSEAARKLLSVPRTSTATPVAIPIAAPSSAVAAPTVVHATPQFAFPPRVEHPPARIVDPADLALVLEELSQIDADIVFNLSSISRWSPLRQRLKVTAWISRARGLEERVFGNYEAHARVSTIAKNLAQLMKIAWPGQVAALQLDSLPESCNLRVEGRPWRPSYTWMDLADDCEASISFLNDSAELRREDEEGWYDAAQLDPVASDADQRLAIIRKKLEEWTGPIPFLEVVGDLRAIDGEASKMERAALELAAPKLVVLAKELRWLRGSDLLGWGECMGRLRWIAHRHRNEHDSVGTLATVLDPEHAPRGSWARENNVDAQKTQQKKEKNRLLKVLDDTKKGVELEGWLAQALSLGDVLPNPKLLEELRKRCDDFLEIGESPASFERNQRARWSWLRAQLSGTTAAQAAVDALENSSAIDVEAPPVPVMVDAGLERLRVKTRGKRALYVSNRNDPDLDEVLKRTFEFSDLRRVVLSPNRVDSASESIKRGGVDLVLAATGFLPHKADSVLKSACVAADVLYVRVDRGRPQACQRHLMRELGVN